MAKFQVITKLTLTGSDVGGLQQLDQANGFQYTEQKRYYDNSSNAISQVFSDIFLQILTIMVQMKKYCMSSYSSLFVLILLDFTQF